MITSHSINNLSDAIQYLEEVPYDVTRKTLYTAAELYDGYDPERPDSYGDCYDTRVYNHYMTLGQHATNVNELLARTLHDHGIHTALARFLKEHDPMQCVGVMGGHALQRTDPMFDDIALLSKKLTQEGHLMLSGGGPGAMEATHLGAWMAGRDDSELIAALQIMKAAPSFKDEGWLPTAFEVMRRYPQTTYASLGIPTWLYGHEPSTPLATHIAKFFENSVREDNILTLAFGGIIFTPGSAGTLQEIFQEAVQNHYLSYGFASPMVFLGKRFWSEELPIFPLLEHLMQTGKYKNLLLTLTDDIDEVVEVLKR